jgi:hypothetical protein
MTVLVGADPEVFVRDKFGRFRSAHGLIPGTKKDPYAVQDGAVQVDGMALEFNITPAKTRDEFIHHIGSVMGQLAAMVPDYTLVVEPTAKFHGNHMRTLPEEALELGCEPDFNAYTGGENPRPDNRTTMRTAAGHVHIGITEGADVKSEEHMNRCITLIKYLDVFLGLPSLLWDNDNKRRSMYGKAGAFRPKPYGAEYRTLSNRWLSNPELVGFVFDQVQACVDFLKSGERLDDGKLINARYYINNSSSFDRHFITRFVIPNYPCCATPPIVA